MLLLHVFIYIYTRNLHWWNWSCQRYDLHLNFLWQFPHLQIWRKYLYSICCPRYPSKKLIVDCWWVRETLHVISIQLLVAKHHFNLPIFQADILISDTMGRKKGAGHYIICSSHEVSVEATRVTFFRPQGCNIPEGMAEGMVRVWGMWCSAAWECMEDDRDTAWCHLIHSCLTAINDSQHWTWA